MINNFKKIASLAIALLLGVAAFGQVQGDAYEVEVEASFEATIHVTIDNNGVALENEMTIAQIKEVKNEVAVSATVATSTEVITPNMGGAAANISNQKEATRVIINTTMKN